MKTTNDGFLTKRKKSSAGAVPEIRETPRCFCGKVANVFDGSGDSRCFAHAPGFHMRYTDRHRLFPDKVIISYPFRWGGQLKDRWMWMAEYNGEVLDYSSKESLVSDAIKDGVGYVVLRVHHNMTTSIVRLENKK